MLGSVQQKLLLTVGGAVVLIFGGAAVFLTTEATDVLSRKSGEVLRLQSERLASALSGEMRENQKVAETLVSAMERYDKEGASRTEASQMVRRVAEKNPGVLGTYLAYEPGAFDGQDYLYEADSASGSNEEGRFAPYWNRYGETLGLSILEDLESQSWYTRPMEAGEPTIKGPFVYDGKMMVSYLHPIERGGKPVGVGGVDVSVDYWQERASQVQIQESGYAFIVSSDGRFVAHPIQDWIGSQTLQGVGDSLSTPALREMSSRLSDERGGRFQLLDPVTGKKAEARLEPIETGGFAVGTVVPREEVLAEVHYLRNAFLGIGLASLLVLLGIVYAVLRWSVTSPLEEVTEKVEAVARGDTDAHIDSRWGDEIGQLADAFNQMVEQIQEALQEARSKEEKAQEAKEEAARLAETSQETSDFLRSEIEDLTGRIERLGEGDLTVSFVGGGTAASSEETDEAAQMTGQLRAKLQEATASIRRALTGVAGATRETASATEQINASSEQMAASAEEQSAQAEEVAAAVEELNQTIGENAKSVQSVAEAAEAGSQQAQRGGEVVSDTTEKMEEIASAVEETASTIESLGASSEEIGQIVDRIDEIAQQTNLLALNAAIEAARAGGEAGSETGQGFAVVAEEVRELAEEADAATTEIAEMIEQVQSETSEAVEAARGSRRKAEEGLELASRAGEAIEEVVTSISTVEAQADEIAAASEQQSTTSEQIARSVQSISTAAQESAAGVTQVSGAAEDLEATAEKLRENVGAFVIEADGAKSGVARSGAAEPDATGSDGPGRPGGSLSEQAGGDGRPSGN